MVPNKTKSMAIIFTKYSGEPASIPSRLPFLVLSIQSTKMDLDRVSLWQRTILHRVVERSSRDPYITELERVRHNEEERERERKKERKKMTETKEGREMASERDRNGKRRRERERETRGEERRWWFSSSWKI